jgi:hypothetical protein
MKKLLIAISMVAAMAFVMNCSKKCTISGDCGTNVNQAAADTVSEANCKAMDSVLAVARGLSLTTCTLTWK